MATAHMTGPREVRLRIDYAGMYGDMPAGEWLPAAVWAERIVTRAQHARAVGVHQRTFDPRHFEFRGGGPPRAPTEGRLRTRATDR
jgi:hypothetical protein